MGGLAVLLLLAGCAATPLPTGYSRSDSHALQDTRHTRLAGELASHLDSHPGLSGFYPLGDGIDAFVARIGLIESADRTLDLQYYIWHLDLTGLFTYQRVLAAADRGVRVRVLLDDLDSVGKDSGLALLNAHPNIELRLFNPFANRANPLRDFLTDLGRVNHRMHNKSLTADNLATIIGGRNIGNEYFDASAEVAFTDADMLNIGPVVKEVSRQFDEYWNSEWAIPVSAFTPDKPVTLEALNQMRKELTGYVGKQEESPYARAVARSPLVAKADFGEVEYSWGKARLLYDKPAKVTTKEIDTATDMAPELAAEIKTSRQELVIVSPYFVPGDELVDLFGQLVAQGVRVRILTNSLAATDVSVVHAGYLRYREGLVKRGVELYEFKPNPGYRRKKNRDEPSGSRLGGSSRASLHAKVFGIDRKILFVGSFNLSPRSVVLNTEMGILYETPELATSLSVELDEIVDIKAYRLRLVPATSDDVFETDTRVLEWVTIEDGREVVYTSEPKASVWRIMGASFLSLLPIEGYL